MQLSSAAPQSGSADNVWTVSLLVCLAARLLVLCCVVLCCVYCVCWEHGEHKPALLAQPLSHTCCSPLQCCSAARGHSFTEKMIYYFLCES